MEQCPSVPHQQQSERTPSLLSIHSVEGSVTSRASTESGIHMGSEHENVHGQVTPEPVLTKHQLSLLNVKRSHSYNVSDTQDYKRMRAPARPKSFVSGWEHSTISPDDILLWHTQLGKLQQYWKPSGNTMPAVSDITKVKKKESFRTRAKSLLNYVKEKRQLKNHKSSISSSDSRCTDDTPDSSSSISCLDRSLDRSQSLGDRSQSLCDGDKTNDLAESLSIVKVFGCHVSGHDAQYRSVLATADTTVLEVKKQAINKYGFTDTNVEHYILCDVIGNYVGLDGGLLQPSIMDFGCGSEEWTTKCIRSLSDSEKPLVLQNHWSPQEGHSRRFELRNRRKLDANLVKREKVQMIEENTDTFQNNSEIFQNNAEIFQNNAEIFQKSIGLHRVPQHTPFLLLINGYDPILDYLIYPLHEGTTTITRSSHNNILGQHYLTLHAPDICADFLNINRKGLIVSIEVLRKDKYVYVNKATPSRPLVDGDTLNIGDYYSFVYKDLKTEQQEKLVTMSEDRDIVSPELDSPDTQRTLSPGTITSPSPNGGLKSVSDVHQHAEPRFIFGPESKEGVLDNILSYPNLCHKYPLMCALGTIMCLRHCFDYYTSDDLKAVVALVISKLQSLGDTAQLKAANMLKDENEKPSPTLFLKAMVRLLSNTLEIVHYIKMQYSSKPIQYAPTFDKWMKEYIASLESLVVSLFEHVAYHSAKMLYELLPAVIDEMSPPEACTEIINGDLPEEHFDKADKRWSIPMVLTLPRKRKMKLRPRKESLSTVNEECFHQNRSKSCNNINEWKLHSLGKHYPSGEAVENNNDIADNNHSRKQCRHKSRHELLNVGSGMNRLVRLLEKLHGLAASSKLNNSMVQQLFTSLFFFANTTLFNTLMEPECASKFFNWQRGTQMRVNLDHMLRWAKHHNYNDISSLYFRKLNALLDLISIPKHELIKSPWKALSEAFPGINPNQLNHILSNYQVLHKPSCWSPSPPLLWCRNTNVKEELSAYPALQLPTRGYFLYNSPDLPDTVRFSLGRLTKQLTEVSTSSKSANSDGSIANDDVFLSHNNTTTYFCKLTKESKSIGLKLAKSEHRLIYITDIVEGSPAHWDGMINIKDELLEINGIEVTGKTVPFCKEIITNAKEFVSLKLKRNS